MSAVIWNLYYQGNGALFILKGDITDYNNHSLSKGDGYIVFCGLFLLYYIDGGVTTTRSFMFITYV